MEQTNVVVLSVVVDGIVLSLGMEIMSPGIRSATYPVFLLRSSWWWSAPFPSCLSFPPNITATVPHNGTGRRMPMSLLWQQERLELQPKIAS